MSGSRFIQPGDLRQAIKEMEELEMDSEEGDGHVQFFLPNSRRPSDDDAVPNRPRSFAINEEVSTKFLLFHTFLLNSQSGPAQIALLKETDKTGVRIVAACRDDTFQCMYFEVESSACSEDEVIVCPRKRVVTSIPLEKSWKVGALSSLSSRDNATSDSGTDVLACIAYLTKPSNPPSAPEIEKYVLTMVWFDEEDIGLAAPSFTQAVLPFSPHGFNQLNWRKRCSLKSSSDERLLLIPSEENSVYGVELNLRMPEPGIELHVFDASASIPELKCSNGTSCVNAVEFLDLPSQDERLVATSRGPRSEIQLGLFNWITNKWTELWKVQHDSMTSRLRLFSMDSSCEAVHLLVIGLCEQVVVYMNVLANTNPTSVVLPESSRHDLVTCCEIADVDGDLEPEIILGTYGRTVLIYKLINEEAALFHVIETALPVCFVSVANMTKGEKEELVVVTQKGVHVYCLI